MDVIQVRVTLFHDNEENPEGASVDQVASVRRAREVLEDAGVEVALKSQAANRPTRSSGWPTAGRRCGCRRRTQATPTGKVRSAVSPERDSGTDRSVRSAAAKRSNAAFRRCSHLRLLCHRRRVCPASDPFDRLAVLEQHDSGGRVDPDRLTELRGALAGDAADRDAVRECGQNVI